jgi:hypothetical protein
MFELPIPFKILQTSLPGQNLSIKELIAFQLPNNSPTGSLSLDVYISDLPPNASLNTIQARLSMHTPSASMIQDLRDHIGSLKSQFGHIYYIIRYQHLKMVMALSIHR